MNTLYGWYCWIQVQTGLGAAWWQIVSNSASSGPWEQPSDGRLCADWARSLTIKPETGGRRGQKSQAGVERMCVVVWKVGVWFWGGRWWWSWRWKKTSRVIIARVGWHIWNDHFLAPSHSLRCSWKNKDFFLLAPQSCALMALALLSSAAAKFVPPSPPASVLECVGWKWHHYFHQTVFLQREREREEVEVNRSGKSNALETRL